MKPSIIQWHDAHGSCEWAEKDEVDKYSKERTIVTELGWIVAEDDDVLVMTSQIASDSGYGNRTRVPKDMIISRKQLNIKMPDNAKVTKRRNRAKD